MTAALEARDLVVLRIVILYQLVAVAAVAGFLGGGLRLAAALQLPRAARPAAGLNHPWRRPVAFASSFQAKAVAPVGSERPLVGIRPPLWSGPPTLMASKEDVMSSNAAFHVRAPKGGLQ
jgi:hypothetical protein